MTVYSSLFLLPRCRWLVSNAILFAALGLSACASDTTRSAAPAPEGYYRVQRGDNLYRIGLRFNQNVNTLMQWNRLRDANAIEVGQLIRVRSAGAAATTPSKTKKPTTPSRRKPAGTAPSRTPPTALPPAAGVPSVALQWPVRGTIISTYNGTTQKGIDIGGTRGTPIKAAAAGTVLYAGDELRGYGRLILLRHSASTLTAYAYNDSLRVRKGQTVKAGAVIATMGDSGTQGVKAHFEIRVNGTAVNPQRYLPR